ncbi:DUF2142 domain-containing protein [Nakamurella aerolata]|uniref:DUF2142 domain-containing protein n=1 Tax=Nakamurella aerolata TaxID=1656892 RepID=A0A849A9I8_9ACTN|nr:DUF2142 domain-containing protein [Nakamurella aerolata]NNG36276.1 DUF2142 domain-containing protein [Nakamurella aerolata]
MRSAAALPVIGGTLLFFGVCLGFLLSTPTLNGADEEFHVDRVVAAAHGALLPGPGSLPESTAVQRGADLYVRSTMIRNGPSLAEFAPLPRDERPSLDQLGGAARPPDGSTEDAVSNYQTQHPPLYYDLMGAAMWLMPGADSIPLDQLVFWLRLFNVLLMLPVPALLWAGAKALFGPGPQAVAAAFLPAFVPGLPRIAATVTNDTLAVLIGAALIWLALKVMGGDLTRRTAVLIAAVAVAGSLTKLTVMILTPLIVLAYLIGWRRSGRPPPPATIATLAIGALLAALWWVVSLIRFGSLFAAPQAWGSRYLKQLGAPRAADDPADFGFFLRQMVKQVPLRLFGSLGLHEPPQLPWPLLIALCASLPITLIAAVIAYRRVRWDLLIIWGFAAGLMVLMVRESWATYSQFRALAGIQGRYVYPAVAGLLIPFAAGLVVFLGRARRWTPAVAAALATLISGWALYLSFGFTWLHRFETLTPGNLRRAVATMAGHFPFGKPVPQLIALLGVAAVIGGLVIAVRCVPRGRSGRPAVRQLSPAGDLRGPGGGSGPDGQG